MSDISPFNPGWHNEHNPDEDYRSFEWVKKYDHFDERPATIEEFLGEGYLEIEDTIRPGVREALVDIFGKELSPVRLSSRRRGIFTGGIGVGKTTLASIAIPYALHWVYCLRDPQKFFNLMPGSRIHFMLMSTSETQAKEVLFGDLRARVAASPWFQSKCLPDPAIKSQLIFPKDLWIIPGNSQETRFEGYNVLMAVIDEGDSHKITDNKDYAEAGWNTIHGRIQSRFSDPQEGEHRGLLLAIGQMKSAAGFMSRKLDELQRDDKASVTKLALWESYGWEHYRDTETGKYRIFYYDRARKEIIPPGIAETMQSPSVMPVPEVFRKDFETDPIKALRDLGGFPPLASDPFISLASRILDCETRWHRRYPDVPPPVSEECVEPTFADSFIATDNLRRVIHLDMAFSGSNASDALGLVMGHIEEVVELGEEIKPIIVVDCIVRMKAPAGQEIIFSDIRGMIYNLRDRGFRISQVTVDRVAGTDFVQQLNRARIPCDYLSVDRTKAPYEDLKDAIYERRLEFPCYMTKPARGSDTLVDITYQELSQLEEKGRKIDHPPGGSKDVADALAGVVHLLTGSSLYRRGARRVRETAEMAIHDQVDDDTKKVDMGSMFGTAPDPLSPFDSNYKMPTELLGATSHGLPVLGPILPYGRNLRGGRRRR